jgi:hypothetical protein
VLDKDRKNSYADCVKNEDPFHRVKEESNILHKIKMKATSIGHILHRHYLLRHVIEEKNRRNEKMRKKS